jgi:hypothetical protein
MKRNILEGIITGFLALGGVSCNTQSLLTGGTGSELTGKACYSQEPAPDPVANARVYVLDEAYLADTSSSIQTQWTVKTDEKGAFRAGGLSAGTYIVEIVDGSGHSIAARAVLHERESVSLGTLIVTAPGAIKIPFKRPLPEDNNPQWYVRVYGTRLVSRGALDSSGMLIGNIPTGIALSINLFIPGIVPINLDFNGIWVTPDSINILPALLLNGPSP